MIGRFNPSRMVAKKIKRKESSRRRETIEVELEKIDIATSKMKEKYSEYESLTAFVDYLSSMEKVFARANRDKNNSEQTKEMFLGAETYIMSLDSGIEEDVFNTIKEDFQKAYEFIDSIEAITNQLLEKHNQCDGCRSFIRYMRDTLVLLSSKDAGATLDKSREKILHARMELLVARGKSEIEELETIYREFREMLVDTN